MKGDMQFMLEAVKISGEGALQDASEMLKNNEQFIHAVFEICDKGAGTKGYWILRNIGEELRGNQEFMLKILKENQIDGMTVFRFASKELQETLSFKQACRKRNFF